jgi:dGTPase
MTGQGMAFEHNDQTLRVVTVLESRSPQRKGLNLNREVLEGLRKHRRASASHLPFPRSMSLEAQVTDKSDETAYLGHDTDDGLRAGLFMLDEVLTIPVVKRAQEIATKRGTLLRSALIHLMILDLQTETERLLAERNIRTLDDVYACSTPLVSFSETMREDLKTLRTFLHQCMYEHPRVTVKSEEGQRIITELCERYLKNPSEKVRALQQSTGSTLPEAVKDYVAGMTDVYAMIQATNSSPASHASD